MSRYIDADAWIKDMECTNEFLDTLKHKIADAPSIDLDDYVPREFHDKTCEAMAKRHQEEIADMVSVVRCKECKHASDNHVYGCMCNHFNDNGWDYHRMYANDFCSRGERKEGE